MEWLEYVGLRLRDREPQVDLRDLPYAEYQDWYRDYMHGYPEDEARHSEPYNVMTGRASGSLWSRARQHLGKVIQ